MAVESTARRQPAENPPLFRSAPHNIELEQALLGAILVNNEAFYRVSDFLEPDHFFEPLHQKIFKDIGSLVRNGKSATPITLKNFLPPDLDVAGLTGSQYLARLAAEATTVINAGDYGRTIYDLSLRRALIGIGEVMVNLAYDAPVEVGPQAQIEDAERRLYELAETGRYDGGFQRFADAVTTAVKMAAQAYERDGKLSGLASGLRDLDRMMGGLQPSDLIIVAGRPGMGKSSLATNIGYNVAKAWRGDVRPDGHITSVDGGIVGLFSLEMSAEQLATRIIAERTGIPSSRIRRGEIETSDFDRIAEAAREMETLPFYIDETGGLSIAQLAARARRLKRQKGLDLLIIDYIQLLQGSSKRATEGRVQEVTEITTSLKALGKELQVPIIALSQLSRQVESRDDKRPQLSDLRESGSIEQDADVVLFVYREEYYLRNREPRPGSEEHFKWQTEMDAAHGKAEVIIGKQRHGPTGTVQLQFEAEVTRFSDLAVEDHLPARM
ncbi:MAG TPA: replicative DNA helicase [Xanthobacteraceae bacterium]|nr:replicative DNA helicase [Xanthobacteraceae bacterium]